MREYALSVMPCVRPTPAARLHAATPSLVAAGPCCRKKTFGSDGATPAGRAVFDKANANYIAFERWILSSGTRIKAPITSRKRRQGQEGGAQAKSARSGDGAALVPGLA